MSARESAKEKLWMLIRGQGYDAVTAAEMAHDAIKEFEASGESERRMSIGTVSFTFRRKDAPCKRRSRSVRG